MVCACLWAAVSLKKRRQLSAMFDHPKHERTKLFLSKVLESRIFLCCTSEMTGMSCCFHPHA
ncbi:hypothetical protein [Parageobacillus thermoglucosidasius]|nr:hypothetical protein [Parageobacillus thermoglucosidasius]